jgi:cytidylate kinase
VTRESIVSDGLCEIITELVENDEELKTAYEVLRRGYPDKNLSEQSKGAEFRAAAKIITNKIAALTLTALDINRIVVALPWRSALAFGSSYIDQGVDSFYHLSSKRDEETLETIVDYESGEADSDSIVIIADPMIGTGNTIVDTIERMTGKGVKEENIIVNCVVAAPVGIAKVKKLYPNVRIIVGALDDKLDHTGYITPGLGDFGDKYFSEMGPDEINEIVSMYNLDDEAKKKMADRIRKQGISETLNEIAQLDMADKEIAKQNKELLVKKGLAEKKPKRNMKIDTGQVIGVDNVADIIISSITEMEKLIAIEGESGAGKSATTEVVAEKLQATRFSLSEVFRYLAYKYLTLKEDPIKIIPRLSYNFIDGRLCLFDKKINITIDVAEKLQNEEVDQQVPLTAKECQAEVIKLAGIELEKLAQSSDKPIIIEGRGFTLDFLPADVRIRLTAPLAVRAERRFEQRHGEEIK